MEFPHLFQPITIRGSTIRNRILSSAHGTKLPEGAGGSQVSRGVPGPRLFQYHAARARGGVGLIIAENTVVFPRQPGWIEAWRPIIDEVHRHGAKMFNQIIYGGRQVTGEEVLRPLYAPSAIPWMKGGEYPREMSQGDIKMMVQSFATTARDVAAGGFDGVELHGAHGYLLHEFMSPDANRRGDEYGGSVRNRARFAIEVVEASRAALPDSTILGMRISAEEFIPGGLHLDEALEIVDLLLATGGLDYISVSAGSYQTMERVIPGMYQERAINAALGRAVKERGDTTVFLVGRINDPGLADQLISDGATDMVAMTRAMVADPEMPNKAREGRIEDIRYCMGMNQGCWGRVRANYPIGCVLNPEAGREGEFADSSTAEQPKSVLVIGGGPSGCESARQLAMRGHRVSLVERASELGGLTNVAAKAPGREELREVSRFHTHELERLGVDVHLGLDATAESLKNFDCPDVVVIATGAKPAKPDVRGLENCDYWITMIDALNMEFDAGEMVVIYSVSRDMDILTVADKFGRLGKAEVVLATPHDAIGRDVDESTIASITARLLRGGVKIEAYADLTEVDGTTVVMNRLHSGEPLVFEDVDTLVLDFGWEPETPVEPAVRAMFPSAKLFRVGDNLAPRGLQAAVWDGAALRLRV